jgi:N-carbamoylputrescine amidase
VLEAEAELLAGSGAWHALAERVRSAHADLVLLNELPFGPWISAGEAFDGAIWNASRETHERALPRLADLGAATVMGTWPREQAGQRVNEAFVWTAAWGVEGVHTKQHFPDVPGFFEARWFQPGERRFRVAQAGGVRAGFLICTDVMFNEHARHYGREGAQVIAVPRATGKSNRDRWLVALRMAAIVSGCYVLSSNRAGADSRGQEFGGGGWVVDPTGEVVAETSAEAPVVCRELDLDLVAKAQQGYPCSVPEARQGH